MQKILFRIYIAAKEKSIAFTSLLLQKGKRDFLLLYNTENFIYFKNSIYYLHTEVY